MYTRRSGNITVTGFQQGTKLNEVEEGNATYCYLYNAEKQLTKALPKLAKNATNRELRAALESHLGETNEQISRLEQIFELLDETPRGKHCAGMAGIIEEGNDMLEEDAEDAVMDACIIAAGQRAEHYEMAAYGTCVAWAKALDLQEVATLLQETLDEEKAADDEVIRDRRSRHQRSGNCWRR